jgi:hypothetical protein
MRGSPAPAAGGPWPNSPRVTRRTRPPAASTCFMRPASSDTIKARTLDTLIEAIRDALRQIEASDAIGWFAHCGYVNTQSYSTLRLRDDITAVIEPADRVRRGDQTQAVANSIDQGVEGSGFQGAEEGLQFGPQLFGRVHVRAIRG